MYQNLDEMYKDLGLCERVQIEYSLLGEIKSSFVDARPVKTGSVYAEDMSDAINIGSDMMVDRDSFHGHGPVLIHGVV